MRASATRTAFLNALVVSLFGLIPGQLLGGAALVVAVIGLAFVIASVLSRARMRGRRWEHVRDAAFLVTLGAAFIIQLIGGTQLMAHPASSGAAETILILVVGCFLVGVDRAWELVGGPTISIGHVLTRVGQPLSNDDSPHNKRQP